MELPLPVSTVENLRSPCTGDSASQPGSIRPQMFRLLFNVFENVMPRDYTGSGLNEWPAILERADNGLDTNKALQALVSILQYLQEISPMSIALATKILADGSRYGKLAMAVLEVARKGRAPH